MTTRRLVLTRSAAVIGAASTGLLLPEIVRAQSDKVRVGFMLPYTGTFAQLGVASQPTDMSLGSVCRRCGVEFSTLGLRGLFAQPARVVRPGQWRMILDILRFYRDAAMKLLRTAVSKGYKNVAHMAKDTDVDPLRQRDDFRTLVAELEGTGK